MFSFQSSAFASKLQYRISMLSHCPEMHVYLYFMPLVICLNLMNLLPFFAFYVSQFGLQWLDLDTNVLLTLGSASPRCTLLVFSALSAFFFRGICNTVILCKICRLNVATFAKLSTVETFKYCSCFL